MDKRPLAFHAPTAQSIPVSHYHRQGSSLNIGEGDHQGPPHQAHKNYRQALLAFFNYDHFTI
jgi:hypothetical protein